MHYDKIGKKRDVYGGGRGGGGINAFFVISVLFIYIVIGIIIIKGGFSK